jgi:hypothetical protein
MGFALSLGAVRITGWFIQDFELVPHSLVSHKSRQHHSLRRAINGSTFVASRAGM